MRNLLVATAITAALSAPPVLARDIEVEIFNVTNAVYFTPPLIAVHNADLRLFDPGTEASDSVRAMAEGGNTSGLEDEVSDAGGDFVANPVPGLLAPGESTRVTLDAGGRHASHLSVTAMLLPTNDGFVGLSGLPIPKKAGRYVYDLHGYDAGTEANDELITGGGAPGAPGIPADPGGNAGTGGAGAAGVDFNDRVHVHRGILGDRDPSGGISDLDSSVHRWNGPVARLVLTVNPYRRGRGHKHD